MNRFSSVTSCSGTLGLSIKLRILLQTLLKRQQTELRILGEPLLKAKMTTNKNNGRRSRERRSKERKSKERKRRRSGWRRNSESGNARWN
jgi:hypothetical protein